MQKTIYPVVVLSTTTMGNGATVYSSPLKPTEMMYASVLLELAGTSNVTVTTEVSVTGATGSWYAPVAFDNSAMNQVASGATASRYISFGTVVACYVRFKVVAAAASTVGLTAVIQE